MISALARLRHKDHGEFQASLNNIVRLYLKTKTKTKTGGDMQVLRDSAL